MLCGHLILLIAVAGCAEPEGFPLWLRSLNSGVQYQHRASAAFPLWL